LDGRYQGGAYYVLEVGDRGEVGIWRRDGDRWIEVLPWTPSDAVLAGVGPTNELKVTVSGERLTFMVNGVQVASPVDVTLPDGGVGVFVGGDGNEVVVETFIVQAHAGTTTEAGPSDPPPPPSPAPPEPYRPITRLHIPRVHIEAEVVPAGLTPGRGGLTWEVPPFRVGHAAYTAGAAAAGNAVLVGHVTSLDAGDVFRDLRKARAGDEIAVFSDAEQFTYRVTSVQQVPRTDISVVEPTPSPTLTLITCTGRWLPAVQDYAERLVVRAELTE
jgi:LPXTG-site transpeptidase (sortase) family protein